MIPKRGQFAGKGGQFAGKGGGAIRWIADISKLLVSNRFDVIN